MIEDVWPPDGRRLIVVDSAFSQHDFACCGARGFGPRARVGDPQHRSAGCCTWAVPPTCEVGGTSPLRPQSPLCPPSPHQQGKRPQLHCHPPPTADLRPPTSPDALLGHQASGRDPPWPEPPTGPQSHRSSDHRPAPTLMRKSDPSHIAQSVRISCAIAKKP